MSPDTNPIMALTVLEPWATLIALGAKQYETRSWPTRYRGPLVIHAGKSREWLYMAERAAFRDFISKPYQDKTLGCALCVVDLVDCIQMRQRTWQAMNLSRQERQFGDFTPGRYAWKLDNVRPFAEPAPWRGAQGLWRWDGPLPEGVTP